MVDAMVQESPPSVSQKYFGLKVLPPSWNASKLHYEKNPQAVGVRATVRGGTVALFLA